MDIGETIQSLSPAGRTLQEVGFCITGNASARTLDRLQRNLFDPALDIRPIKDEPGTLRLRVGDWRVIFEVNLVNRTAQVRLIGPRGDIYKKL